MDAHYDEESGRYYSHDGMTYWNAAYIDEFGKPIERTPDKYSYSYDGYMLHRFGKNEEANMTIYSDRLLQWDYKKHNELCKKHFGNEGQYWAERDPKKIEAFLRDWCEDPELKLIFVMQYCNMASGYPLWRFDFHTNPKDDTERK